DGGISFPNLIGSFNGLGVNSYQVVVDDGNCQVNGSLIVITGPGVPPAPTAGTDATYCEGDPISDLTANADSSGDNNNLTWYDDAGLTSVVQNGGGTFTPAITAGSYVYYITETVAGCQSPSTQVSVDINPTPAVPVLSGGNTYCDGEPISDLQASAGSGNSGIFYWFDDVTLLNNIASGPVYAPSTSIGTQTYYVVDSLNGCGGLAASVVVTINPLPAATISGGGTICVGDPIPDITITLTGTGPWDITYTDGITPASVNGIVASPYTLSGLADGTYTITIVTDANCTGTFNGSANITTETAPDAGTNGAVTYCSSGPGGDLFTELGGTPAGGGAWSPVMTSGTGVYDPVTDLAGTYTYTVAGVACPDATTDVVVTITSLPSAPTAGNDSAYCDGEALVDLFAAGIGGTLNWYSDAGLTSLIGTGNNLTPSATIGTVIYYVTETLSGCEGPPATVTITINALPVITSETFSDATACGVNDGSIDVVATGGTGVYSFSIDGGISFPNLIGSFNGLGVNSYQVVVDDGNCQV
ncbi:MAG TPA: hypothetical protein EYQ05_17075, partial [Gammaproteobacteria bacterium]|nr:hypothetical protein [Gammaproteobacteria bacterium]